VTLAFYISGHGFGHAARQIEVINAVHRREPATRFFIRTSAARWLLEHTIDAPYELDDRPCDIGVVQIDALTPDIRATIALAREFYGRSFNADIDREAAELQKRGVDVVIADVPPLACAAAARVGLPCVAISNFTWDWIYADYVEIVPEALDVVNTISAAYRLAKEAWRLPMHGGFKSFAKVVDVPFVARHARRRRAETRERLGLPRQARLALSSFGGYGVSGIDLSKLDTRGQWEIVVTGREAIPDSPHGVRFVHERAIYAAGLRYEDLVGACDAVLSKPGYGIVSECIANDTALVYTSRGRFIEYGVLVAEMPRYLRCSYISNDDLLAGRWRGALDAAVGAASPPERPRTDGADVIADMIAALC
jgi:hypothetical protein